SPLPRRGGLRKGTRVGPAPVGGRIARTGEDRKRAAGAGARAQAHRCAGAGRGWAHPAECGQIEGESGRRASRSRAVAARGNGERAARGGGQTGPGRRAGGRPVRRGA
ncbi:unnamed protein product, partial [Prorocentrum cordatum]